MCSGSLFGAALSVRISIMTQIFRNHCGGFRESIPTGYLYADHYSLRIMSEETTDGQDISVQNVDIDEQIGLGRSYSEDGPSRDIAKAVYHYRLAADAGSPDAALAVADLSCREKTEGWKTLAEHYYRCAIGQGIAVALKKLGDLYYLGDWDSECAADPKFGTGLYKRAALLYFEYVKREGSSAGRELQFLGRMLSSNWLHTEWSFYGPLVECLAENDNDDALHIYLDGDIPEPTENYGLDDLLAEKFELPGLKDPSKRVAPLRSWGRVRGRRNVTSVLYDMGVEFSKSRNGIIKTKKGEAIREEMEKIIAMGYKFKYSSVSDKWSYKEPPKE